MRISIDDAKARLDLLISKSRVDLYKPIQIAEVLYHSRVNSGLKILDVETYRNLSIKWRNDITRRLLNKISTSSARYQHDIWNKTAMPPETLFVLDAENRATKGQIERYIYMRFSERQQTVADVMAAIDSATPKNFELQNLLALFVEHPGIRRSIDKAYEIVAHSLFETVVTTLGASVRVRVPEKQKELLKEFEDLGRHCSDCNLVRLNGRSLHIFTVWASRTLPIADSICGQISVRRCRSSILRWIPNWLSRLLIRSRVTTL